MKYSPVGAAFAAALVALSVTPVSAPAAQGCSTDAFTAHGTPLTVVLCVGPPVGRSVPKAGATVIETLATKGQEPIVRRVAIDAALADAVVRTIDDAPLGALGISGTLHMTIAYRGGSAHLEHALLVPGAIVLK